MRNDVNLKALTIMDPEVLRAQDNTVRYLLSLDPERFLFEFDRVAHFTPKAQQGYLGWERSDGTNFRGHFFGHYLSALAQALNSVQETSVRMQLRGKLMTSVAGLARAQEAYGKLNPQSSGYVSAFREVALDEVEGRPVPTSQKENVLVPWYNLHKILAGLVTVYQSVGTFDTDLANQALVIATRFGNYVYRRMAQLSDVGQMLKTEYGGMNDALYQLFELTHDERHLITATYFDEMSLFQCLAENRDVLPGKHANTTIPKLIGALRRYELFQDRTLADRFLSSAEKEALPMYLAAAKNFWEIVRTHHMYITGGNSQSEHFHEADRLFHDAAIIDGAKTCETCNTHNMLKLSRELFKVTGDKQYLDYYERTYINAILASQNPRTGMMTYFQPMGAGYNKIYNRPYDEFWCCTGTGIESFTKLGDSYYFQDSQRVYLSMYFSNQLELPALNLCLNEQVDRKHGNVVIEVQAIDLNRPAGTVSLALRRPDWLQQRPTIYVNHKAVTCNDHAGFWNFDQLTAGDQMRLHLPMTLTIDQMKDNQHYIALQYGPYVLAGNLDQYEMMDDRPDGILVRIATRNNLAATTLTTHEDWPTWQQALTSEAQFDDTSSELVKVRIPKIEEQIDFVPYYQVHDQCYGIYFQWQQVGSVEAKRHTRMLKQLAEQKRRTIGELVNFDNNNAEFNYHLQQIASKVGDFRGRRYRQANARGSFSYLFDLTRTKSSSLQLVLRLHKQDLGRTLTVRFNDDLQADYQVKISEHQSTDDRGFFEVPIVVPQVNQLGSQLKLTFLTDSRSGARLFGIRLLTVD
ncbi:glycoside hydrolase family 127 protein [Sporolactobacillus shoreicorticis]|uniref:Glycoside hydrolase family 127 protein n=1 Tax=Sporolactobacillus shoreicorticis TaxID=1923877 RepID=A0ABW5S8M4_9BACL|nr:beta-L-arabinofuranosidase domain-containing protein [Sporolactobacillus shoreicorticis]MCO7127891.1 glycoside hydrolase family 127 protein [Sporolactobacillus shoreicorticis]